MKIVQKSKIFVASLAAAAVLAGCPAALAVSPAGYNVPSEIEQTNAAEDEQVQAIKAAAAKVTVSFDEVDRIWDFDSPYKSKAGNNAVSNTAPWMFILDGVDTVYFGVDFTCFAKDPVDLDTVVIRAGDTRYSFECQPDYTGSGYIKDTKSYIATADFDLDDEMVGWFRDMLAQDKVIVRFVDGGQYIDYTWTAEDRQAITDMINLYDMLKAASPEMRARALNS